MKFAIAVHGTPLHSQAAESACHFPRAALAAGHYIQRVFFYHDGVRLAFTEESSPDEQQRIAVLWSELKSVHQVELAVCVGAATRRNLLPEAGPSDTGNSSLYPDFEIVGLGQLIDAIVQADRFITFAE